MIDEGICAVCGHEEMVHEFDGRWSDAAAIWEMNRFGCMERKCNCERYSVELEQLVIV